MEIAIICILYRPNEHCVSRWKNLYTDDIDFIFVDNSPSPHNNIDLPNYIALRDNYGIGEAQNRGIFKAKELGCRYVIFFDQDSRPSLDLVNSLKDEYLTLKNKGVKIGALGPSLIEIKSGSIYKGSSFDHTEPKEVSALISSGLFTEIATLDEVGYLNRKLFIDLVDFEWCWRAHRKGYLFYQSSRCIMPHQVGNRSFRLLGMNFIESSPQRYYYQYRNALWLFRCGYAPKLWKRKTMIRKIIGLFIIPFKTGAFFSTLKNITTGIVDGIRYNL